MRQIKFRGYNSKNQKWIYGYYFVNRGEHFICVDGIQPPGITWEDFLVNPDSVGQFTGMYDKDGREIYNGDILGTAERIIGHVDDGVRGYCYDVVYFNHPAREERWSLYGTLIDDYYDKIKIIGNIYENPELIEKQ